MLALGFEPPQRAIRMRRRILAGDDALDDRRRALGRVVLRCLRKGKERARERRGDDQAVVIGKRVAMVAESVRPVVTAGGRKRLNPYGRGELMRASGAPTR